MKKMYGLFDWMLWKKRNVCAVLYIKWQQLQKLLRITPHSSLSLYIEWQQLQKLLRITPHSSLPLYNIKWQQLQKLLRITPHSSLPLYNAHRIAIAGASERRGDEGTMGKRTRREQLKWSLGREVERTSGGCASG